MQLKGKGKNPVVDSMNTPSNEPIMSQIPQNYPSQQISVAFFNPSFSLESQLLIISRKRKQTKRTV